MAISSFPSVSRLKRGKKDGVRAGAKRLGRKKEHKDTSAQSLLARLCVFHRFLYIYFLISPSANLPYLPPKKPYEFADLARDLVLLARYLLKPHGRLVFFLPTVTEEYEDIDVQTLLCDGMDIVANSLQDFGSWGRRVRLWARYACHLIRFLFLTFVFVPAHYPPENDERGLSRTVI